MSASRCSICSINYPSSVKRCWGCGDKTSPVSNLKPSETWREDADEIRLKHVEAERTADSIPTFDVVPRLRDGLVFLSSWEICDQGYVSQLVPDTLVKVQGTLYEVIGYTSETREYWVEEKEVLPNDHDVQLLGTEV
jgi:hypothetical protein